MDDAHEGAPVMLTGKSHGERAGEWTVTLAGGSMTLAQGERVETYSREEIAQMTLLLTGGGTSVLVPPHWKTGLGLEAMATSELRRWMLPCLDRWGTSEALRTAKATFLGALASIAFFIFDGGWFLLAYGVTGLVMATGRRFAPGRWLFLGEAARNATVAVTLVLEILVLDRSAWWLLFSLLLLVMLHANVRKYRFFGWRPEPDWP